MAFIASFDTLIVIKSAQEQPKFVYGLHTAGRRIADIPLVSSEKKEYCKPLSGNPANVTGNLTFTPDVVLINNTQIPKVD